MDGTNRIKWQSTFCSGGEHDIWCVTHLCHPMLVAALPDRMFDCKRIPRAVPSANIVWIQAGPDRSGSLVLRSEAMRIIRQAREEYHKALGKGWHPSFIIGGSYSTTVTGPGRQASHGPSHFRVPPHHF